MLVLALHPLPLLPGTKINWCASLKPPQHVRSEWAAAPHGLTHLGPDSQAFDAALDTVCSKLGVCRGTALSAPNLKLAEGLSKLGLHVEDYPRNCNSDLCSAYCNLGCRSGHKQSSEVWLQDAVRAGAHILTGVQAQRVLMASHKVRVKLTWPQTAWRLTKRSARLLMCSMTSISHGTVFLSGEVLTTFVSLCGWLLPCSEQGAQAQMQLHDSSSNVFSVYYPTRQGTFGII